MLQNTNSDWENIRKERGTKGMHQTLKSARTEIHYSNLLATLLILAIMMIHAIIRILDEADYSICKRNVTQKILLLAVMKAKRCKI